MKSRWPIAMDSDQDAQFGPPDKRSNFNKSRKCRSDLVRKSKGKSNKITDTLKGIGQRVEVRYNDGLGPGNEARYKGTLIEFNVKTGNWMARLDANIEVTTIKFPIKMSV